MALAYHIIVWLAVVVLMLGSVAVLAQYAKQPRRGLIALAILLAILAGSLCFFHAAFMFIDVTR